jgi:hypothetical protein
MIKSRRVRWAGHVAPRREKRNAYRILVGKPEGKRQLGRPKRRWVGNIRMDLREIVWDGMDWIGWDSHGYDLPSEVSTRAEEFPRLADLTC